MKTPPIKIFLDSNERNSSRAKALVAAHFQDNRFGAIEYAELPADVRFDGPAIHHGHDLMGEVYSENPLLVELKEPADFVSSVFSGHLYDQCLSMREISAPCMVLITGEWSEVMQANRDSCLHRGAKDQIASNYLRLKSFRKRAYLQGIRIFYPGDDSGFFDGDNVYKDLLEMVADIFTDGSLIGFRPRPADNERQVIALATLCKIGPKTAKSILTEFGGFSEAMHWLQPYDESARERLLEIDGIGPKTVAGIWRALA